MEPSTQEALLPLIDIMRRHGATCTPTDFHTAVNVTFHNFESEVYDSEHTDMWDSLPQQVQLFAGDCLRAAPDLPDGLRVLDIGCGTGLASQCLLWSDLGKKVASIDLLDTSPSMLRQVTRRAATWGVPIETCNSLLDDLAPGKTYDLIITCSVLHHVPDLATFLAAVRRHQAPQGLFLHLQDPNGDYLNDPELIRRQSEYNRRRIPESISRFAPFRLFSRLYRELTGTPSDHYVAKTNRSLIERGIITSPLTFLELYSVTDIHVNDGGGISVRRIKQWLSDYDCVSLRSYGFFGVLWSMLPDRLKRTEEDLSQANAPNGFHVGAAWRLR